MIFPMDMLVKYTVQYHFTKVIL